MIDPWCAILCGCRILGFFSLLPLGWDLFGTSKRLVISAALTLFLVPRDYGGTGSALEIPLEFCAGVLLALPAALLIDCVASAAELSDTVRGQTLATAYDPLQQETSSMFALLVRFAFLAFLFESGVLLDIAARLGETFDHCPPGSLGFSALPEVGRKLLIVIPVMANLTVTLCFPFAVAALVLEACAGLAAKQVPGLSLQGESFWAKLIVGTYLVLGALENGSLRELARFAKPIVRLLG